MPGAVCAGDVAAPGGGGAAAAVMCWDGWLMRALISASRSGVQETSAAWRVGGMDVSVAAVPWGFPEIVLSVLAMVRAAVILLLLTSIVLMGCVGARSRVGRLCLVLQSVGAKRSWSWWLGTFCGAYRALMARADAIG